MKVTIQKTGGWQDTFETVIDGENIILWHTMDGKDYRINSWDIPASEQEISEYISEYIENFYDKVEII